MVNRDIFREYDIRGVVKKDLTVDVVDLLGKGFGTYLKGYSADKITVGGDVRLSTENFRLALINGLRSVGIDVIDIGIVPTPTVELMVKELKADGGIVISASHNSIEWNAFKFINSSGTFLNAKEIARFFNIMDSDFKYVKWDKIGKITYNNNSHSIHIKKILNVVNKNKVKQKGLDL